MRLLARVLAVNKNLIPTKYLITHAVILDDKNSRQGQDLYCIQNSLVFKRSQSNIIGAQSFLSGIPFLSRVFRFRLAKPGKTGYRTARPCNFEHIVPLKLKNIFKHPPHLGDVACRHTT